MDTAELLFETLRLTPHVDLDDLTRAWSETRPDGLLALAHFERAAMWIMRRLTETEAVGAAPEAFVAPLRRHVRDGAAKNLLVDAEAVRVLEFLSREAIPCVLLKGVARRALGSRLPCGDARTTMDVDVIVPRDDVDRAWKGLRAAGYERASEFEPVHHAPTLIGAGSVGVELHTSLSLTLPADEAWRRANDDARDLEWNGLKVRVPAPTELLWHGLTHALDHGAMSWRLRFFLDAASILAADEPVAWDMVGARLDADEIPRRRAPRRWLEAAARFAATGPPPGIVQGEPAFDVVRALRWRLSVLRERGSTGFGGRLLEEATRRELKTGLAPGVAGTGLYKRTRRRLGGLAARVVYGVWRALGAREMRI